MMDTSMIKVLLVEDNNDHAYLAKIALETSGNMTVIIVKSAEKCLETINKHKFNIILLDYNLPIDNGLELLKHIKNKQITEAPVVLVTGHGHEKVAVEAMQAGAFDYIVKSSDYPGILPNVVKRVLEKYKYYKEKKEMEAEIVVRNNELQVLNSISAILNQSLILDEIINSIIPHILEKLDLDAVAIFIFDNASESLVFKSGGGLFLDLSSREVQHPESYRLLFDSVKAGKAIIVNDLIHNTTPFVNEFLDRHLNSFISIPLSHKSKIHGTFLAASKQEGFFTERRLNLLSAIINQISIAIENSNLYLQTNKLKNNLENLLNSSLDLIVTLDINGTIKFYNERFAKVLGYGHEVIGKKLVDFVSDEHKEKYRTELIENKSGKASLYEIDFVDPKNKIIACLISQSMLKGRDEFLMIIKDISKIVQLQKQLIQSEKLSALGQMIAGAAHELNNPLAGIMGYGQLLLEESLPESVQNDIRVILKEASRCQEIIKNLLSFARRQNSKRQDIDVNKMLMNVLTLQNYQLKVNGIKTVMNFEPKLPQISGDYDQLQQVFVQLINNAKDALKLTNKSFKEFVIITEKLSNAIRIKFIDNGCGIAPENKNKIFDPFFTTKEVGGGTGLGLSMCFGIIQSHQGKLYVESTFGEGAIFIIELPILNVDLDSKEFKVNNLKPISMPAGMAV